MDRASMGRYELLEPMAAGGMAELFLARARGARGFEKLVVVKRILPHLARDQQFVAMFLNEARLASSLEHPNLVAVLDFGEDAGDYFLALEYVHGADLNCLLGAAEEMGDMPFDVALSIVAGACAGLHHAHEQPGPDGAPLHLVHRDVSPSNVLISYDGAIKVTDFGIATATAYTRATQAGTLKGKRGYMSPEQCKGLELDRRSDVFGLGILLYETTLLHRLFWADNDYAVMNKIVTGDFKRPSERNPDFPRDLEAIVMRALAPDPDDRYESAAQLQSAIERFAIAHGIRLSPLVIADWIRRLLGPRPYPSFGETPASTGIAARSTTDAAVEVSESRARPWLWAAAAVGVLGLAGGGVMMAAAQRTDTASETPQAPASQVEVVVMPAPIPESSDGSTAVAEPEPELQIEFIEPDVEEPAIEPKRRRKAKRRRRRTEDRENVAQPVYNLDDVLPPQ